MITIDIHSNHETVSDAISMLDGAIKLGRKEKDKLVCLIVGYGSKGTAHKIRSATIEKLIEYKEKRFIKDFIIGSDLDIFNLNYQKFIGKEKIGEEEKKKKNPGAIYISL